MLHYQPSRHRRELPSMPQAKVDGRPDWDAQRASRHGERPLPAASDVVPWVLAVLAVVTVVVGLKPFAPDGPCMSVALDRGGTGWSGGETSLWPPGVTCTVEFENGRTLAVEETSWGPVFGAGLALAVWGIGLFRPPNWSWRRAAHVLSVPILLGSLVFVFLATEDALLHHGAFGVGAFLALGLVPAGMTAMASGMLIEKSPGRIFAITWPLWSLAIGGLFAL